MSPNAGITLMGGIIFFGFAAARSTAQYRLLSKATTPNLSVSLRYSRGAFVASLDISRFCPSMLPDLSRTTTIAMESGRFLASKVTGIIFSIRLFEYPPSP